MIIDHNIILLHVIFYSNVFVEIKIMDKTQIKNKPKSVVLDASP